MTNYNTSSLSQVTVTAGEAIPIYRFMQLQADGFYDVADDAQGVAQGVSAEAISSAEFTAGRTAIAMQLPMGIVKVEAGAAVTRGGAVATDTVGRVIDHTTTAGNYILGWALESASAAGEIIAVQMCVHQDGA